MDMGLDHLRERLAYLVIMMEKDKRSIVTIPSAELKSLFEFAIKATDPCTLKREPDEPMFVLLARDSAAPETLKFWSDIRAMQIANGRRSNTPEEWNHVLEVREKAKEFLAWRKANRP